MPGKGIVVASWLSVAVFAATAIPLAAGVETIKVLAVTVALILFFLSLLVWSAAFVVAVQRSARGDDIVVASLFFTMGGAALALRKNLWAALLTSLVVAAVSASTDPFGVMVPMLTLGFLGLAGARYGSFPPKPNKAIRTKPR